MRIPALAFLGLLLAVGPAGAGRAGRGPFRRPPLARSYPVISPFGQRHGKPHAGTDLKAPRGTPIYAVGDGTVSRATWVGSYGWVVYLDHPGGWQTRYAHMAGRPAVAAGSRVRAGTVLGAVGATGNASTPHLHFEVRGPDGAARDAAVHFRL